MTATTAGTLDNTASASSDVTDPDPSDDADTASTTVSAVPEAADLEVVKTAPAGPVYVGDDLTYTIVVTNNGPDTAHDVTLTDPLDADLGFVSTDHGGVEAGGDVTWNLGDIVSGDAVTVGLVVGALAPAPTCRTPPPPRPRHPTRIRRTTPAPPSSIRRSTRA